jgi:predicted nucleotide-binding protein (sugar kinase/HSP70/actin superfamily)
VAVAVEPGRKGVKLLQLPVRFGDGPKLLRESLKPLCREFHVSAGRLDRAIAAALRAQSAFQQDCITRGQKALAEKPAGQPAVVIVARPYNGCDPGVSLDLPNKLRKLGVLPIPMDFLDLLAQDVGDDHIFSNMYWKYGQRILRAAKLVREDADLNAVYLSNFSCGPDSFLISYVKRIMGNKPSLILEIDEHSADAGVITRLEAFLESLANADPSRNGRLGKLYDKKPVNCDRRTIYVPSMSDAAYALVAAFRACGQPAEVLPLATEESLQLGRRHTTGKECLPCIVTTGDMLLKCREPGFDRDRAAFFMPGGSGPCRFGQYNCYQKIVLNESGFDDIPVIAPNQDKQFYEDFKQFSRDPTRLAWIGISAIDLFTKSLLSIRPYEVNPGDADRVYEFARHGLCKLIESNPPEEDIFRFIDGAAAKFEAVGVDHSTPRPRIGIVGEIYVRTHTFSNQDLVRQLESLGAEVDLATISEWMYYTNFTRSRTSWREKAIKLWLANRLKHHVQRRIERRIARRFRDFLPNALEPDIPDVLKLARPYIDDSFEGEACLSTGKMVEYFLHGCHGLINVMPFTCMPSTIVAGLMKALTEDLEGIPAISIAYDGQTDPTLHTRLEAFVHQADAFRRASARRGQPVHA